MNTITKKEKGKTQHWVYVPPPVTADDLIAMRDRLTKDASEMKKPLGMRYTLMHRVAIDCDHLSRLIDADTGTKRLTFMVRVKPKAAKRKAKSLPK